MPGPFVGIRPEWQSEQDARAARAEHESRMKLIEGIRESINNPGTNNTIGDLLRAATPLQRARVRAHLEGRVSENYRIGAPIEAGVAERALRAFDAGEYVNGHIARYLSEEVIERIFR